MKNSIKLRVFSDLLFGRSQWGGEVHRGASGEGGGQVGWGATARWGGGNSGGGGQQWGFPQHLRTALHTICIRLQNSLS